MQKRYEIYVANYLNEVVEIVNKIDRSSIVAFAQQIQDLRTTGGRLFILGVGGSAANASHAVNDFRKIAGIECYSALDNVSELTARINDEGWDSSLSEWLKTSKLTPEDALLILSVGGGSSTTSQNLVRAMQYAKFVNASVLLDYSSGAFLPTRLPTYFACIFGICIFHLWYFLGSARFRVFF